MVPSPKPCDYYDKVLNLSHESYDESVEGEDDDEEDCHPMVLVTANSPTPMLDHREASTMDVHVTKDLLRTSEEVTSGDVGPVAEKPSPMADDVMEAAVNQPSQATEPAPFCEEKQLLSPKLTARVNCVAPMTPTTTPPSTAESSATASTPPIEMATTGTPPRALEFMPTTSHPTPPAYTGATATSPLGHNNNKSVPTSPTLATHGVLGSLAPVENTTTPLTLMITNNTLMAPMTSVPNAVYADAPVVCTMSNVPSGVVMAPPLVATQADTTNYSLAQFTPLSSAQHSQHTAPAPVYTPPVVQYAMNTTSRAMRSAVEPENSGYNLRNKTLDPTLETFRVHTRNRAKARGIQLISLPMGEKRRAYFKKAFEGLRRSSRK